MSDFVRFEINQQVTGNIRNIQRRLPGRLQGLMSRFTKKQKKRLKRKAYPPKLPNQIYVRTFRLKRSWKAKTINETTQKIINKAPYSGWVAGKNQAEIHRVRWWIAADEVEKKLPELINSVQEEIL